jgi:hypothetical protein
MNQRKFKGDVRDFQGESHTKNDQMNDKKNEWMNEWMKERKKEKKEKYEKEKKMNMRKVNSPVL